jgi:hypothetical protein
VIWVEGEAGRGRARRGPSQDHRDRGCGLLVSAIKGSLSFAVRGTERMMRIIQDENQPQPDPLAIDRVGQTDPSPTLCLARTVVPGRLDGEKQGLGWRIDRNS